MHQSIYGETHKSVEKETQLQFMAVNGPIKQKTSIVQ